MATKQGCYCVIIIVKGCRHQNWTTRETKYRNRYFEGLRKGAFVVEVVPRQPTRLDMRWGAPW